MKLGVFNSFTLFFSIGLIVIVGLSYTFFMNIEIVEKSITHSLSLEKISKKLHFSKLSNGTLVWSNQHQMRDSHTTDNKDDSIGHFLIYFNEILELFLILLLIILSVYFNLSSNTKVIIYVNILFIILFVILNKALLNLQT